MIKIYGIALIRVNGQFILKASNGRYYKHWDKKQDRRHPLNPSKLKEINRQMLKKLLNK